MMNQLTDTPRARSRIVMVGAGYAGYHCARHLERRLPREAAEIVIVSPTDYMPYTSLLPEVGTGTVDPRHIAVSLSATLRRTRHIPGHAVGVDYGNRSLTVAGPDGQRRELGWHRLVLTPGSVSRTLPLPGISEQAKGFKNIAEALYLHDHMLGADGTRRRQRRPGAAPGAVHLRRGRRRVHRHRGGRPGPAVHPGRAAPLPADPPGRAAVAAGGPRPGDPAGAGPAAGNPALRILRRRGSTCG